MPVHRELEASNPEKLVPEGAFPEQSMWGAMCPEQRVPEDVIPEQFWTMATTPEHGVPARVAPEHRSWEVDAAADIIPRV